MFSNAYVYVLPSDLEGMPLSLLEAMSYGNCCVTSDIEECAAVTEDRGVTFPKGNEDELEKTLQMLCDRPETVESYRKQAAEHVMRKYNWDEIVKRTLEVYQGDAVLV